MATTPPPQQAANTPPTPLHGAKYDTYQPYSPRKSTRSTVKRNLRFEQTPPPPSSSHNLRSSSSSTSPKFTRLNLSKPPNHTFSPPSSTQSSPQKKIAKKIGGSGRITRSGDFASQSLTTTTTTLELAPHHHSGNLSLSHSAITTAADMLPTPAKTPRKRPTQPAAALKTTARVLFPTDPAPAVDALPSPKKKAKKGRRYNGFSLDSFTGEEGNNGDDGRIAIFTDSKDRVPELDQSEDNPFYVKKGHGEITSGQSSTAISKRKKLGNGTIKDEKIEQALHRDDGMVYVFRGKKVFRKFEDDADEWDESEITAASTSPRLRPFTRSSIKPRLLFETEEQRQARTAKAVLVDEEAITDIEEQVEVGDSEMTDVAGDTDAESLVTPSKDTFTPASPPASGRVTRKSVKEAPAPEPVQYVRTGTKSVKKISPFDSWQRSKSGVGLVGKGKKREGDVIERSETMGKRVKGS
ncbi:MAG: hypothetical protein M1830_009545 [Pleopsidium flavum]|nr:MAG: hypothetical protein M1830_009545 [Pleopsidium flavum]